MLPTFSEFSSVGNIWREPGPSLHEPHSPPGLGRGDGATGHLVPESRIPRIFGHALREVQASG